MKDDIFSNTSKGNGFDDTMGVSVNNAKVDMPGWCCRNAIMSLKTSSVEDIKNLMRVGMSGRRKLSLTGVPKDIFAWLNFSSVIADILIDLMVYVRRFGAKS